MNRPALYVLALSLAAGPAMPADAAPANVSPADFAFGMEVVAAADAAAYRVALPLDVYRDTARGDLADIRVFNARGEVVPYALYRPSGGIAARGPAAALPVFALHSDAAAAADAIRLTIDSPQAAIKLQAQQGGAAGMVRQYILDGRALEVAVDALQLTWPEDAADFAGRLRIEASDNFADWRTLADAAPVANLHANGQQLINNRVTVPATRAKYWRLTWLGANAPFVLAAVAAEAADNRVEAARSTLEVPGSAQGLAPGEYQFDLDARLPLDRVNLALPEVNTVLTVELLSRMHPQDPWRHVARGQFYRVNTADGELRNRPLDIAMDSDRYWLVRATGASVATTTPPRLQAAWIPSDLVFLARGAAPFMLAFGNAAAAGADTDLSSVVKAMAVQRATLSERRVLGGQARLAAAPAPFPWKRVLLWAVLALSVCLLAWMAYRLSKDLNGGAQG